MKYKGVDVNQSGYKGLTPLHYAAMKDQHECAEVLVSDIIVMSLFGSLKIQLFPCFGFHFMSFHFVL